LFDDQANRLLQCRMLQAADSGLWSNRRILVNEFAIDHAH
jgi:hypothetical protein